MRIWLWAVVLVAGFLAMSLGSFWLAVRPPRIIVPETPRDYGLPFEELTLEADDGLRLAAWLVPAGGTQPAPPIGASGGSPWSHGHASGSATDGRRSPPARASAIVVLLHGYPAEKADLLPVAAALHPHFATLLVDLRYFGQSQGRATTLGFRERGDLARAVDLLAERGVERIGVFGYSLGGAVALMGAAEDPRIRAVVAYAPFSDLRLLGHDLYGHLWLLRYPLVGLMLVWSRLFLGADITRPTPADAAARLAIPVLLIHNRDDEQIPFAHATRLQQALAGNPHAQFDFGSGLHNDRPAAFERRLVEFFLTHLQ